MIVTVYITKRKLDTLAVPGIDVIDFKKVSKKGGYATLRVEPEAMVYFQELGLQ